MSQIGLRKGVRAPSAIINEQHYDKAGASRGLAGTPGIKFSVVDATVAAGIPLKSMCSIRVITTAPSQFLWIGDSGETPPATLNATNSILLSSDDAPETFHMGVSKIIRTTGSVQVVVFE